MEKDTYKSIIKWKRLTEIPFIRGAFNFIDSMVLGIKTLTYSASLKTVDTFMLRPVVHECALDILHPGD